MGVAAILLDIKSAVDHDKLSQYLDITLSKIRHFTDEIYFLSGGGFVPAPDSKIKVLNEKNSSGLLDFMKKELDGKSIFLLPAYAPMLDVESTRKMFAEHEKFRFDYTYPENLPLGVLPEIIESEVAGFIRETVPKNLGLFQHSIREIFERDVSSYDCNIFISQSRIIQYRVNFIPDTGNNALMLDDIIQNGGTDFTIESLEAYIQDHPEAIRKRPTYYEIELSTEREAGEFFVSGRMKREGAMKAEDLRNILKQIADFSINPVVSFGLFGEPFLYPNLEALIELIQGNQKIQFLFESRGLFTDITKTAKFLALPNVRIIFDLSSATPAGFAENKKPLNNLIPLDNLTSLEEKIKSLPNTDKIYIQFTRTTKTENELMKFYERWKDYSDRIVIKKLDTFGGELDSFRVIDLSPVRRFPCLHLKHDLVIFYDGTVPICREDYNGKYPAGNLLKDGIATCWNNLAGHYKKQWALNFSEPPLCKGCDEWWVFNF